MYIYSGVGYHQQQVMTYCFPWGWAVVAPIITLGDVPPRFIFVWTMAPTGTDTVIYIWVVSGFLFTRLLWYHQASTMWCVGAYSWIMSTHLRAQCCRKQRGIRAGIAAPGRRIERGGRHGLAKIRGGLLSWGPADRLYACTFHVCPTAGDDHGMVTISLGRGALEGTKRAG